MRIALTVIPKYAFLHKPNRFLLSVVGVAADYLRMNRK